MTDEVSRIDGTVDSPDRDLSDVLSGLDVDVVKRFRALVRSLQLRSVFVRNRRMADWFDGIASVASSELKRREGNEAQPARAYQVVLDRTTVLTDQEIEAIAMGFSILEARRRDALGDDLRRAINAAYEPIRREYLVRQSETDLPVNDESTGG